MKATLFVNPVIQFFSNTGAVLAGGSVTFYAAGSTTPKNTYTDSTKGTANANPVVLDTAGRPDNSGTPVQIWLDGSYKVVLKDSTGATIRTEDNVTTLSQIFSVAAKSANYTVTESDQNKLILVDASSGNITISLLAAATAGAGFQIGVKKVDAGVNTVTIDGNLSELINGDSTLLLSTEGVAAWLCCTGTAWEQWAEVSGTAAGAAAGSLAGIVDDTNNNGTTNILTLTHTTSGSPAANIGTGIIFKAESADENPSDAGQIGCVLSDVTSGSEDSFFFLKNRVAGAALSDAYYFNNTGGFAYSFTGAPTATRTISLPDNNITMVTYGARAYRNTTQAISNATITKIQVATEEWDSQGNFDNVTNYRFTVPTGGAGKYLISGSYEYSVAGNTIRWSTIYIYKNGSVLAGVQTTVPMDNSGATAPPDGASISTVASLADADYIELYTYQNNSASVSRNITSASLSIIRLAT